MSGGSLSEVVIDVCGSVWMRTGDDMIFRASQREGPEFLDDEQWCTFVPGEMVWVAKKWQVCRLRQPTKGSWSDMANAFPYPSQSGQ